MKNLFKLVLVTTLSLGVIGCSANSVEADAEEARVAAADARADAAEADARVTAADAHVRAADAAVDAADANARVARPTSNSADAPAPRGVIPSGTLLKVTLVDSVDSDKSSPGDVFLANLSEAVVSDGVTLLQKGTQVRGRVVDAKEAGRVKGRATISLKLTDLVQGDRTIP